MSFESNARMLNVCDVELAAIELRTDASMSRDAGTNVGGDSATLDTGATASRNVGAEDCVAAMDVPRDATARERLSRVRLRDDVDGAAAGTAERRKPPIPADVLPCVGSSPSVGLPVWSSFDDCHADR